jgi:hypothetical protein
LDGLSVVFVLVYRQMLIISYLTPGQTNPIAVCYFLDEISNDTKDEGFSGVGKSRIN